MRPKILTMRAFGPYGGTEVIDFTLLEDINMFLIHGPTGAGKTTILDAICYALYGQTNGGERTAESMRSKFATSDEPAEVTLIFTLKGEEYKVIRSPRFERPKKRGEGFTVEEGKALLYKKEEDEYKLVAARLQEVDRKIEELLVFNVEQFRQVIMIAQNKFRELLTADSKARQKILQDIFETGIYQSVEKKLEERSSKLNEQMKEKNVQYEIFMSQLKEIENEQLKPYVETNILNNSPEVEEILVELIEGYNRELETNKLQEEELKNKLEATQKELLVQNEKYTAFKELEKLEEQLKLHKERESTYKSHQDKVSRIEKILPIIPIEEEVNKTKEIIKQTGEAISKLQEEEKNLKLKLEELAKEEAAYEERRKTVDEEKIKVAQLEAHLPKVEILETLQQTTQKKLNEINNLTKQKEQLIKQIETEEKQIKAIEEGLKRKEELQNIILQSQVNLQQVDYILEYEIEKKRKQEERLKLLEEYKGIGAKIKGLKVEEASKQKEYDMYVEQWMSGQAGILAESLEEGTPCPVCGSEHHPKKAIRLENEISFETIRELEVVKNQLLAQISKKEEEQNGILLRGKSIQEDIAQIENRLKTYAEKINIPLEKINAAYKEHLKQSLQKAQGEVKRLEELEQQIDKYKSKIEKEQGTLETLKETLHLAQIEVERNSSKLEEIKKEVPENLQSKEELIKVIDKLKKAQEAFEIEFKALGQRIQTAKERSSVLKGMLDEKEAYLEEQNQHSNKALVSFKTGLDQLQIGSIEAYKVLKQEVKELEGLKSSIVAYEQEKAVLSSKEEMIREKSKDFNESNLERVKGEFDQLTSEKEKLQIAGVELIRHINLFTKVKEGIHTLYMESGKLGKKQYVINLMTSMAKGRNSKGLSFERYIQSSIFDEVLESANNKLRPMTTSRYELYRTDDLRRKNAQAGLDIAVIDHYVGQTRPVNTLSGGESFMAALALALGLADVISRLAGASSLDTMFIDEGFGTLDEESLELAIKTLLNLQDTGRLVGIISHVKELREQIPARLEITSTHKGSKASFKL